MYSIKLINIYTHKTSTLIRGTYSDLSSLFGMFCQEFLSDRFNVILEKD